MSDEQRRFDEEFRQITSRWDDPEDDDTEPTAAPAEAPLVIPAQWRSSTGPSIIDEHEPDFVPPEPEPLPKDEMFWVTIGCLVGGPVWFLYLWLLDPGAPALWWVLASVTFMVGILLVLLRQPANRDDDDPFDDGARV